MKLLLALSLLLSVDNQAMARKLTMPKWVRSGDFAALYLPVSVATAGFVATTTSYLMSGDVHSSIPIVGGVVTTATTLGTFVVGCIMGAKTQKRVIGYVGKHIIYRDDAGNLKSGTVVRHNLINNDKYTEMDIVDEDTTIDFKDIVATQILNHRDVGREIEILTEADDTQALHYAGQVVHVFDNGFYELELIAKVDPMQNPLFTDDIATDSSHAIEIEPRRIIIDKNSSLKDGGFRFSRDNTRRVLGGLLTK